jgi:hypothetical protein
VAELPVKNADAEDPEEVQAHGDYHHAGYGREYGQELTEHLSKGRGRCAQGNEDDREPEDEENGSQRDPRRQLSG